MALPRKNKERSSPQTGSKDNSALLETPTGRAQDSGASDRNTLLDKTLREDHAADFVEARLEGSRRADTPLGETDDGLDSTDEAVRQSAEDTAEGPDKDALAEDAALDKTAAEDRLEDEETPDLPTFEERLTEPKT